MSSRHSLDQPTEPPLSFEAAIALAQGLLAAPPHPDALQTAITELVQTDNGARGFFVTWLTGDSPLADQPPAAVLTALKTAPERVAELLTKNLAMSTAMEITHLRQQAPEQAAGSARVQQRTRHLIQLLQAELPVLTDCLQELATSVTPADGGKYQGFLQRWGYDLEQRQAIQAVVAQVL
jgi:hypothetical protein